MAHRQYVRYTREEIYKLVWSQPLYKLAPTLGLSDRGLAILCDRHKITYPGRGYWLKVNAGKKPKKLPLPRLTQDAEEIWLAEPIDQPEVATHAQTLSAEEKLPANRIVVPNRLTSPHRITQSIIESLREAHPRPGGLLRARVLNCVAVSITLESVPRAMRILDALAMALEARGFVGDSASGKPNLEILGERIAFRIEERLRQEVIFSSSGRRSHLLHPTERLVLVIDVYANLERSKWGDRRAKPLEEMLNDFVSGMILATDAVRERRIEHEEWQRQREADEQLAELAEQQREAERRRVIQLDEDSEQMRRHEWRRRYVESVRAEAASRGVPVDDSSGVGRWLLWAERRLAELDPFGASRALPEIAEL